jgi:molybdate transport system substrate-binding protein
MPQPLKLAGWVVFVAGASTCLGSCNETPKAAGGPGDPVVVFAASSLTEVVSDITAEWTRSGRPVRTQFAATSDLARQIQEGAAADLFIAASPEWLDKVAVREKLDWLSNRLVVVVPKEAPDPDLTKLESLALANEQVPAGKYAKAAMTQLKVEPPARTIYGANVRDVLSKVAEGGAQAGIVYATDAAIDPRVRIVFTFPLESHPPIAYAAGLLSDRGRDLFAALREPWVRDLAVRHGFLPIE